MRRRFLKWICEGLIFVACACAALGGLAEAAPEETNLPLPPPFVGHFEQERIMRATPRANTDPLISVPKDMSLYLTPVNDRYAETSYQGVTGYIFYQDAIPDACEDVPVAPYVAYSSKALSAYAQPHLSGEIAASYAAFTPLEVLEENGFFAVMPQEDGSRLYISLSALLPLKEDTNVAAYRAYLRNADVLYRFPLAGSPVEMVLRMGEEVVVSATNGDYAYVNIGVRSGYVQLSQLASIPAQKSSVSFAYVPLPTVLYDQPSVHAYTDHYVEVGVILEIDGVAGGFSHVKNLNAYVPTESLQKLEVSVYNTPFMAYWETERPLYKSAYSNMSTISASLAANTPKEIRYSFSGGRYYLIQVDDEWGFISKADVKTIKTTTYKKSGLFVARMGTPARSNPIPGDTVQSPLSTDVILKVSESFNGFVKIENGESYQYVAYEDLERVQEVKKVTSYEAYLPTNVQILDSPHAAGKPIATAAGNRLVRVTQQNDAFAYVSFGEVKGYISLNQVWKMSNLLDDSREIVNYYIFVNKATRELTVYYADQDGNKTDRIARDPVVVAIGKRTTPTPAGTFSLGNRERWHYFGPSFVPFAIKFAQGRYLHGPLYYSSNEGSLMQSTMSDFGKAVTGGCIRLPYEDMLWIYCHCMDNNAVLEIVNGV